MVMLVEVMMMMVMLVEVMMMMVMLVEVMVMMVVSDQMCSFPQNHQSEY